MPETPLLLSQRTLIGYFRRSRRGIAGLFSGAVCVLLPHVAAASTVAYWQLDEAAGAFVDVVGGHDLGIGPGVATLQAALLDPVPNPDVGPFSDATDPSENFAAADFSRTAGETSNSSSALHITEASSFTFEGFFLVATEQTGPTINGVIGGTRTLGGVGEALDGWMVWMRNEGRLGFIVEGAGFEVDFQPDAGFPRADDGLVHHFALVWDHDGGTSGGGRLTLFLDGQLYASADDVNGAIPNDRFMVGWRSSSTGNAFPGLLDELRFSDSALSRSDFLSTERIFDDGFETGDVSRWSTSVP